MGNIAIIHRRFGVGGGESVCFHILESLQARHKINLYCLNEPDFSSLNDAFGTNVCSERITVHTPTFYGVSGTDILTALERASGERIGSQGALHLALMQSDFHKEWTDYDLRITTHGELPLPTPTIQYIHHPFLNRWRTEGHFAIDNRFGQLLNRALTKFVGASPTRIRETALMTNSRWSANQLQDIYGTLPDIVYPPIRTEQFNPQPWEERENGFVTVGRIAPDKRTLDAFRIIDEVRSRGHEVHLHIAGPAGSDDSYNARVQDLANAHEWVTLEGKLPQRDLNKLIESHRWGLNTKPHEHFGMVIAEYITGGMIPFVPNSGGQVEVVEGHEALCYNSNGHAAELVTELLDAPAQTRQIWTELPDIESRFGVERFKKAIRNQVSNHLG